MSGPGFVDEVHVWAPGEAERHAAAIRSAGQLAEGRARELLELPVVEVCGDDEAIVRALDATGALLARVRP